jgi:hypothetical protein
MGLENLCFEEMIRSLWGHDQVREDGHGEG